MSSTAQPEEMSENLQATGTDGPMNLRDTVAERLAAHRSRRAQQHAQLRARQAEQETALRRKHESVRSEQRQGATAVRDAVRARYEGSQSYREFLAAEAERALVQAQAEAEVAARTARAVADAQMQLLEEMAQWPEPEAGPREIALEQHRSEVRGDLAHALADIAMGARELMAEPAHLTVSEFPAPEEGLAEAARRAEMQRAGAQTPALTEVSAGGLTVKLYEDFGTPRSPNAYTARHRSSAGSGSAGPIEFSDELQELEQEIDFRRSPEFAQHIIETTPIPGNLIEFPRELVAARKARPRLAEGPLRDGEAAAPQLRIFEVEPEQETALPSSYDASEVPDWQTLRLEANREPQTFTPQTAQAHFTTEPQTAPLELRVMAALVDGSLVGAGFLGFAAAAAYLAGPALQDVTIPLLLLCGFAAFAVFWFIYQMLFFTFASWTPGMLYARISLCTFGDRNPSRQAMRRRVFSTVLAACPLGLGLLWMWMDDDRLGWHDRMSRMYQRAY